MSTIVRSESRILLVMGLAILFIQLLASIYAPAARADDRPAVWSWSAEHPTVFESNAIINIAGADDCPTFYQFKNITGEDDPKQVCMASGDDINFGVYFTGRSYQPTVSFRYDSKMYKVRGAPCGRALFCRYLPGTDTLVTSQNLINGYVRSLVVYKNFTHRLTKAINELWPYAEYHFDASNPDYIFRNTSGYAWPVGGFGGSSDGKWLAVEFRQRGIGMLNIETLEMRRVSSLSFNYGVGSDPSAEFSVSDGGRQIAITGANVGLSIFDIDPGCGEVVTDDNMQSGVPPLDACKQAFIDTETFIHRFRGATHPLFDSDGSALRFYTHSYTGELREVTLRANGYKTQRVDYLALGDSFTSGEGETDDKYYIDGTNDSFEKCHVSKRSYPYLIANTLGIEGQYVKSVACSGAVTSDIIGDDKLYAGQGGRLAKLELKLDETKRVINQTAAKHYFIPGRVHQISFVKKYQPKIITVGIGGNDVGFMDKLTACVGRGTCAWAGTTMGREKTAIEIKSLFSRLVETYSDIHNAAPSSKIYAIGYPKVINPTGQCDYLHGALLDADEKKFMDEGVAYINQIIAAAARRAGIRYIDVQDSFGQQVLCGESKPIVMSGIRVGDDSGPWDAFPWLAFIGQESFHPRPKGHAKVASAVLGAVPDMMNYKYCADNLAVCPEQQAVPSPSEYWLVDGVTHGYASQRIARFTHDSGDSTNIRNKTISLAKYSFAANSTIRAEIQSDPIALGEFVADENGATKFEVELPHQLSEGFHTIHLYGTSYSGEEIDLYEVIKYQMPIETDKASDDATLSIAPVKKDEKILESGIVYPTRRQNDSGPSVLGVSLRQTEPTVGAQINNRVASVAMASWRPRKDDSMALFALVALATVLVGVLGLRHYRLRRR